MEDVVIPAILWSRGHVILLMAPTTPARNANVTPSITGFHPPRIRPPQEARKGRGAPRSGPPCVRLSCFTVAFTDRSVRCLHWLRSSSQAEWILRSLEVWKSQRGSGKVLTPQDLQLNPQGWWWFEGGSVCWSPNRSDVTFRAN